MDGYLYLSKVFGEMKEEPTFHIVVELTQASVVGFDSRV